jgi:hypothetical protein
VTLAAPPPAALWAATAAAYAFVVLGPGAALIGMANGSPPFDLRFAGYTLAAAQGYLGLLGAAGRMHYLAAVIPADMIFATLFAVTMAASAQRAGAGAAVAALCALPGLCDIAENLTIARMLAEGSGWPRPGHGGARKRADAGEMGGPRARGRADGARAVAAGPRAALA